MSKKSSKAKEGKSGRSSGSSELDANKKYDIGVYNAMVRDQTKLPAGRTLYGITVQDLRPATDEKDRAKVDNAGVRFPDFYYSVGDKVTCGKKDTLAFAKAFKGKGGVDTAEWPSGMTCVKCLRCDGKPESAHMMLQKHLRLIGKTNEKKITCRIMPKLCCDGCYMHLRSISGGESLPGDGFVEHGGYWARWMEMKGMVEALSEDFIKTMSEKVANGRTPSDVYINEFGHQTVKYEKKKAPEPGDDTAAPVPGKKETAEPVDLSKIPMDQLLQAKIDALTGKSGSDAAAAPASATAAPSNVSAPAKAATLPAQPQKTSGGSQRCDNCGNTGDSYLACGRCRQVWYCGKTCQTKDWKARHKAACKTAN